MWVKFTEIHRHRFTRQMMRKFMPGEVRNIPTAVAEKAIADGHAVKMKRPSKSSVAEVDDGEERG